MNYAQWAGPQPYYVGANTSPPPPGWTVRQACLLPQGQVSVIAVAHVGDLLLQHKEHAELLQSYDERRDAAVMFIQAVRPELRVQTAALRDPQVHPICCFFLHPASFYIHLLLFTFCPQLTLSLTVRSTSHGTSKCTLQSVAIVQPSRSYTDTAVIMTVLIYFFLHICSCDMLVHTLEVVNLMLPTAYSEQLSQPCGVYMTVQEPTGAATMPEMEAIVVSKETVKGAHDINLWRQEHGSTPLTVVTVDLVGRQGSSTANKLSSTRLRMEAAQRLSSNATS